MFLKLKTIAEIFHFTQKERNGIIALLCIIFILLGIHISLLYLVKNNPVNTSAWEAEVKQYTDRRENEMQEPVYRELKPFDPNNTGIEELTGMGVPVRVASNWIRYLEKGGRFKEPKDIRKIYGLADELYNRLEGYILIPAEVNAKKEIRKPGSLPVRRAFSSTRDFSFDKMLTVNDPVELNLADSAALENLPGIGTVLAPRIIRYRKLLGGFYSVDQLRDVYGLSEEHFRAASPHLIINGETFRRFNINFASIAELGRHPYIGFRIARKLVKLRDGKGKFYSDGDLSEIMSADSISRLSPYLKFNE